MTVREFYDVFDFEAEVITLAIDFKTKGYSPIATIPPPLAGCGAPSGL